MSQVPLAFFQVGAAAIPTLLVAVAVGAKQGDFLGGLAKDGGWRLKASIFFVLLLLVGLVITGELVAAVALVKNGGNNGQASYVWSAMTTLFFIVMEELIRPVARPLGKWPGIVLQVIFFVIWSVSLIAFDIML